MCGQSCLTSGHVFNKQWGSGVCELELNESCKDEVGAKRLYSAHDKVQEAMCVHNCKATWPCGVVFSSL